jgi:polyhydroxybutyrate depolymerase
MKYFPILAGIILIFSCCSMNSPQKGEGKFYWDSVKIDGNTRRYLVQLPLGYESMKEKPLPLVLMYHGAGGTPAASRSESKLGGLADEEKFIVVFPAGYKRTWADGRGMSRASKDGMDDLAFTREMLKKVEGKHKIDPARIYAAGVSNGGFMVATIACEMPEKFAAFVTVIASVPANTMKNCNGAARPLAMISGTTDPLVPWEGGIVKGRTEGKFPGMEEAFAFWKTRYGCTGDPTVTELPDKTEDETTVTKIVYGNCAGDGQVVLFKINNGGHQYPDGTTLPFCGNKCTDISATREIWNFFKAHTLP